MTKITFVYPDFESLGVEYLMAVCRNDGHMVDFVYYQAEDTYLGRIEKNIPFQQIAKKIADTQPHIVAFSCVTDNYLFQLRCAKDLKEIMPNVITIFGGVHATAVPDKVLQNAEVDCVAVGEAEKSFSDFLKEGKIDDKFILPDKPIKGIVYKEEGKRLTKESYLTGGSMSNPKPYYSISLLLNYLPILPKFLVSFLVYSRFYRMFRIKNFFISTAIPRFIQSIFNPKDFRGRSHIIRFVDKTFVQRLNKKNN
ncbi:MAG: cobalamin-dependent protein [Candidatus Aminicenantes bacterium]|nr:cobalamin-dependent protein [Candidatus Aminicenantes bacterium]